MKKLTLLIYACVSVFILNAQTKSETEEWILDKLRNNQLEFWELVILDTYKIHTTGKGFEYSISNGQLVVNYTESTKKISSEVSGVEWDKKTLKVKLVIPLEDFETLSEAPLERGMGLTILQTDRTTIRRYEDGELLSGGRSSVYLGIRKSEQNIIERLNKAFKHLQTFYPRKKVKEVF